MSTFFGGGAEMPEPVIVADPSGTAAREAAAREAGRIKRKRAMARTIFTGPEGLLEEPNVLKQTLGGGWVAPSRSGRGEGRQW